MVSRAGVKLREIGFGSTQYAVQMKQGKPVIYTPAAAVRAKNPEEDALLVAHELGHVRTNTVGKGGNRRQEIQFERDAWAKGMHLLRGAGKRVRLDTLKTLLTRTLGSYATSKDAYLPKGLPLRAAIGTPRQRASALSSVDRMMKGRR